MASQRAAALEAADRLRRMLRARDANEMLARDVRQPELDKA
jgi:hypothetical protein